MLTLEALSDAGQVISAIAVVVSLIYLAFQVRQNTASLRTENYARALDRIADMQARLSADKCFAGIVSRGAANPARLTAEERIQFSWAFYEMFGAFEFMYLQWLDAAMPAEVWNRWAPTLQWWLSLPGVEAWWRSRPTPFSPPFTALVDSMRAAGPPDPAASERHLAFMRCGATDAPPQKPPSEIG